MSLERASAASGRLDRWIRSGWTLPALAFGELLETTVLPWPIEVPLAALMMARRRYIPLYLAVVVGATLIGSALMYAAGFYTADALAGRLPFLSRDALDVYQARFDNGGFWTIASGGLFPVPWQIVTVSAGAAGYDFGWFMLASLIGRGLRFSLLAAGVLLFGPQIVNFWRRASSRGRLAIWAAAIAAVALWILILLL